MLQSFLPRLLSSPNFLFKWKDSVTHYPDVVKFVICILTFEDGNLPRKVFNKFHNGFVYFSSNKWSLKNNYDRANNAR